MAQVVFAFKKNEQLAKHIIKAVQGEKGNMTMRQFPDGESYVRVLSDVSDKNVIVVCTLNRPDNKLLPLLFLCRLLKEQKAKSVTLVVPYLSYMRQDKQFNEGEAVTSVYFAELLSSFADKIITIDPHLHRRTSMQEIYSVPCEVLHAAPLIAQWIKHNVPKGVLIGPDSESKQWVAEIARAADAPYLILEKKRSGDRNVEISIPQLEQYKSHVPILIDDIISTGQTMIETIHHLQQAGTLPCICIGIHAVFAGDAFEKLQKSGAGKIITCTTIQHESNGIDVSELIVNAVLRLV